MRSRREVLGAAAAMALGGGMVRGQEPTKDGATQFELACMTLPWSGHDFSTALGEIARAGFTRVAWGVNHREVGGKSLPLLPADAPVEAARDLARKSRDAGLAPVMMFSVVYPEANEAPRALPQRLKQCEAAGIGQLLTFGHAGAGGRETWRTRFREWAREAADRGVTIVIKQHGGETGSGAACAAIVREIDHPAVRVNYDAGNVMDYLNLDPLPDVKTCADVVHSFCLKDHRNFPRDEDCAPGFGEIDHYRLLDAVARLGRRMPLVFENITPPGVPRPTAAAELGRYARRAREFIELVIAAVQSPERA